MTRRRRRRRPRLVQSCVCALRSRAEMWCRRAERDTGAGAGEIGRTLAEVSCDA
jgi:hypothetical protein